MPTQNAFRSLLIHRCTIIAASRDAVSSASYGHQAIDWAAPTTTYSGIACRWRPLTNVENKQVNFAGEVIADSYLYMAWATVPATLKPFGAQTIHRVTAVLYPSGVAVEGTGFYEIYNVDNQAGESHHIRLMLKRIG